MVELPASVTVTSGEGGLPAVDIATPVASARIYLYGAHVASWTPAGGRDVLWLSPASAFEEGTPIRGGIPLCLPWFAKGPGDDKEPMHGLARLATWELAGASDSNGVVALTLGLALPGWTASYAITVGEELKLELTTTNHSDTNLLVEEALHTYFAVADVAQVSIAGLDGARYLDKVSGEDGAVQVGDLTLEDRTDRVYESTGPVRIADPAGGRSILIAKHNSANTVVWNPWEETTTTVADIPNEDWPRFVCVETANVRSNATLLTPGTSHTIATAYRVGSAG